MPLSLPLPPVGTTPAPDDVNRHVGNLYQQHHRWLEAWLRHKVGSVDSACDIAQDTFLRILKARDKTDLHNLVEPRAYLRTVARHILINFYERQTLEQAYLDALALLPEAQVPSPEQRMLVFEALQEIDAMLDSLPEKVRRAFLLSQLDGLTYGEIATRLGISERTVKRHMACAFEQCLMVMP